MLEPSTGLFDPATSCDGIRLFEGLSAGTADAGSTFVATASTDPGIAAGVARLTNGAPRTLSRSGSSSRASA